MNVNKTFSTVNNINLQTGSRQIAKKLLVKLKIKTQQITQHLSDNMQIQWVRIFTSLKPLHVQHRAQIANQLANRRTNLAN